MNKKKNRKKQILTAVFPLLGILLFAAVLVLGVKKQTPVVEKDPVQGIHADSSLKGYLGTGYAYAGEDEGKGENDRQVMEQAQILPEEEPEPTVTPTPTQSPASSAKTPEVTVTPEPSPTAAPEIQPTETPSENDNNNDQNDQSNTIHYDEQEEPEHQGDGSQTSEKNDDKNQQGAQIPDSPEEPQITEAPAPTLVPDPDEDKYPVIATDLTDGETVNASYRTFYIQATDHYGNNLGASSLQVTGNGQRLSMQGQPAQGILAYRLELTEGANTIEISATDEEGWTTTLPVFTLYKGDEEAPETAGSVTISIEAGTIGLGTILPATSIEFYQGEQLSSVLLRLLQNTGFDWRNDGNATSGFYLKAIGRGGIAAGAMIPEDLLVHLQEVNCQLSDHDANWIGEFDFTMDSGWMYSVNGEYMNVGMSAYFPADGDEVRLRFSLYSGADIGGGASGEVWGDW